MERVSFEIERQDVAEALYAQADAAGHSVQAELADLVERTYAPVLPHVPDINRLIELGRGLDFEPPARQTFIVDEPEL